MIIGILILNLCGKHLNEVQIGVHKIDLSQNTHSSAGVCVYAQKSIKHTISALRWLVIIMIICFW